MSGNYIDFVIKKTSMTDLHAHFKQKVSQTDDPCSKYGGWYYGGWDRAGGLNVLDKTFSSRAEAKTYVLNYAEAYGPAVAVTYIDKELTEKTKNLQVDLRGVAQKIKMLNADLFMIGQKAFNRAKEENRENEKPILKTVPCCKSRFNVSALKKFYELCPICGQKDGIAFIVMDAETKKSYRQKQMEIKRLEQVAENLEKNIEIDIKKGKEVLMWYVGFLASE